LKLLLASSYRTDRFKSSPANPGVRSNPDLVERLATGAALAEIDWPTVYDSGRRGYSDYPSLRHAMA
jgi:hypothetical protein